MSQLTSHATQTRRTGRLYAHRNPQTNAVHYSTDRRPLLERGANGSPSELQPAFLHAACQGVVCPMAAAADWIFSPAFSSTFPTRTACSSASFHCFSSMLSRTPGKVFTP